MKKTINQFLTPAVIITTAFVIGAVGGFGVSTLQRSMNDTMAAEVDPARPQGRSATGTIQLTPEKPRNLFAITQSQDVLREFNTAIKEAEMISTVQSGGPFTVFAPVNAGFEFISPAKMTMLYANEHRDVLTELLEYHIVPGVYPVEDMTDGMQLVTLQGDTLTIRKDAEGVYVNGVQLLQTDLPATNGIMHTTRGVLYDETK
jgi:uncharacterized surface protein with fasciclin (FAS1) repeats